MSVSPSEPEALPASVRSRFAAFLRSDFQVLFTLFRFVAGIGLVLTALIAILLALSALSPFLTRIPRLIQIACLVLILLAAVLMALMILERNRTLAACQAFLNILEDIPSRQRRRADGLAEEQLGELRRRGKALRGAPRLWWKSLDEVLASYRSVEGQHGWFLTQPAEEILTEDRVIAGSYHASFHEAVPGILTALGLLATFASILIALAGVNYNAADPAQPVAGMDGLINGLSGKFLSSIIALLLSVLFTFVEKKVCERAIYRRFDRLLQRTREALPYLPQSRILLDMQKALTLRLEDAGKL